MDRALLQKIRSIAIEALDQDPNVARIHASGSWPAIIIESCLWVPRGVYHAKIFAGLLPPSVWDNLLRAPVMERHVALHQFAQKPGRGFDLIAVEYRHHPRMDWDGSPRKLILIDPEDDSAILDPSGMVRLRSFWLLEQIDPTPQIRKRWDQVYDRLAEEQRRHKKAKVAERAEWNTRNKRLCRQLVNLLSRSDFRCPNCGRWARDYRHFSESYFICSSCGRSFFPADLPIEALRDLRNPGTIRP